MFLYKVGVDEVGRGPLAGPVAVGVVKVVHDFDWNSLPGVNDSKKLSESKREQIFVAARRLKAAGQLDFVVSMVAASVIDRVGIVPSIIKAQAQAFKRLNLEPADCHIKLDGGLTVPKEFSQETIIKGDSKEKVIGLASIMAKVTRDRYMTLQSSKPIFAPYDFAKHKGYGTKAHQEAIKKFGLTSLHRQSYCKNLL